jgi:hypothetical protein
MAMATFNTPCFLLDNSLPCQLASGINMDTSVDFQGLVPNPTQKVVNYGLDYRPANKAMYVSLPFDFAGGFKMPNFEDKSPLFPLPSIFTDNTNDMFRPHGVDHVFENISTISINFYKFVLHY